MQRTGNGNGCAHLLASTLRLLTKEPRANVQELLNPSDPREIVFVRGRCEIRQVGDALDHLTRPDAKQDQPPKKSAKQG